MFSQLKISKNQLRCLKISAVLAGMGAVSSGIAGVVEAFGTDIQKMYALEVCLPLTIFFTVTSCAISSIIYCTSNQKVNNGGDPESKRDAVIIQKTKKIIIKPGPMLKPRLATQKPSSLILNPPEEALDHKNENNSGQVNGNELSPAKKLIFSNISFLDLDNVAPSPVLFSTANTDRNSERASPQRIVSEKDSDRRYSNVNVMGAGSNKATSR